MRKLYLLLRHCKRYGLKATYHKIFSRFKGKRDKSYQRWWQKNMSLTAEELEYQKNHVFAYKPLISIAVPVYNTLPKYLSELIDSVRNQTYANWELCICDGSSTRKGTLECLRMYAQKDERIRVIYLPENQGISGNTNEALKMVRGDYIALADHDDILTPDALFEMVKAINAEGADLLYSDEDKMDKTSKYFYEPHFKPDLSWDKLRCCNYFCHLLVFSHALLLKAGLLRSEFDGSQDHDLALRLSEKAEKIVHIPRILYHWRQFPDSMSKRNLAVCQAAGRRAVAEHLKRVGLKGEVEQSHGYRIIYDLKTEPLVSIIMVLKENKGNLCERLKKIKRDTAYARIEMVLVDLTASYGLNDFKACEVKLCQGKADKGLFYNLNLGAKAAAGEYLAFIDESLDFLSPDWLSELLMYAVLRDVGAVGGRLYYADQVTTHSAGCIVADNYKRFYAFQGQNRDIIGYCGLERCVRNVSALPVLLMLLKNEKFWAAGGFDTAFHLAYGDVDLCIRLLKLNYRHVYTPYAEVCCKQAENQAKADEALFRKKWQDKFSDIYYNPNLTQASGDYSLNNDLLEDCGR